MNASYTLPKGFYSAGIHGGIKKSKKHDMGLIFSPLPCSAAAFYTKNALKAAHITLDKKRESGAVHAVFANSGNANALMGSRGIKDIEEITACVAAMLGVKTDSVLAASTGKISKKMDVKTVTSSMPKLVSSLARKDNGFPKAIMTTDLTIKTATETLTLGGKKCVITAAAKGSGMIAPDMATMLCFVMTDAAVGRAALKKAGLAAVEASFNRVTVDGDMSPNDTVLLLANGAAGGREVKTGSADFKKFRDALCRICYELADDMVMDGEGATKFVKITVKGAASEKLAKETALHVANSALVKTMFFGMSMNPGRIISAVGAAARGINTDKIVMKYNGVTIIEKGGMVVKNIDRARKEQKKRRFEVEIDLKSGRFESFILTTDFSYDYVRINADYS